jgi:hypothetical protein
MLVSAEVLCSYFLGMGEGCDLLVRFKRVSSLVRSRVRFLLALDRSMVQLACLHACMLLCNNGELVPHAESTGRCPRCGNCSYSACTRLFKMFVCRLFVPSLGTNSLIRLMLYEYLVLASIRAFDRPFLSYSRGLLNSRGCR